MNIMTMGSGLVAKVSKDWFTSADGTSYAIGKALAVFVVLAAAPLPWVVLFKTGGLSLTEAGLFYGGLGGSVMALILGTHPAEPKVGTTEQTTVIESGPKGTTTTATVETVKPMEGE